MELQFHKNELPGMRLLKREVRNAEQTQELHIPDGMPAAGRVLSACGQILLRSKEWQGSSAQVTGGVAVSVLYIPEDGKEALQVDTWLPFQVKWDLPGTDADGILCTDVRLRSADARCISAGKLLVRVNVGVMGEFWAKDTAAFYTPPELPGDVALLRRTYPLRIPRELGEKPFSLEEELTFPANAPKPAKLMQSRLHGELTDRKILSDKVVFRGVGLLQILYKGEDGGLHTWHFEVPFSQYGELDRDYTPEASVRMILAPTSMEAELDAENRLRLKAGMTAQYLICDGVDLEVVEDAYSPRRTVKPQTQTVSLTAVQEMQQQTVAVDQKIHTDGTAIDLVFLPDHPAGGNGGMPGMLNGQFQYLYRDEGGQLQGTQARWEQPAPVSAGPGFEILTSVCPSGNPQTAYDGSTVLFHADMLTDTVMLSNGGIAAVTALELGELTEPDSGRPSLILRRAGNKGLWQTAKECGSTVEAILAANLLDGEPSEDKMLLIPVL